MVSRRSFFRWLAVEGIATVEEMQGRPQLRLAEIPKLPDDTLAEIIPAVCADVEILVREEDVAARVPGHEELVVLFARESPESAEAFVFNRFNGRTTIGEISSALAAATSSIPEESFARVKGLFLALVRESVCVPGNSVG